MDKMVLFRNCGPICAIATGLIGTQFAYLFTTKDRMITHDFIQTLDETQRTKYKEIIEKRFMIYTVGTILGLVFAFIFYWMTLSSGRTMNSMRVCIFIVLLIGVPYVYYMIAPKGDYMLTYLKTPEQIQGWLDVYRYMQLNCHLGFAIGVVGYMLLAMTLC